VAAAIIDLADAVTAALNGEAFSQAFTAERSYRVTADLTELAALKVAVLPGAQSGGVLSRGQRLVDYRIDVGLRRKTEGVAAEYDALMALADFLTGTPLVTTLAGQTRQARCIGVERNPLFEPQDIDSQVFTAVLAATYRVEQS
jgi:hypothetical protein